MGMVRYLFEKEPSQEWTNRAYVLQQEGKLTAVVTACPQRELVVEGPCPRCGGRFSVSMADEISAVRSGLLGGGEEPKPVPYVRRTVRCAAEPAAEGAPSGAVGCGACFSVYALEEEQP